MRSGRQSKDADRDQKSVEPPRQRTRRQFLTEQTHVIKQCTGENGCGNWFACYSRIKHGILSRDEILALDKRELLAFDKDSSSAAGLQSNCKQCKDEWELEPQNIFARTRAFLVSKEPGSWDTWERTPGGAFAEFQRKWERCGGACKYCGAGLREWQISGHILDRIDNLDRSHSATNTTLCCWPCNHGKGTKSDFAWKIEIKPYVDEYGRGNVPHGLRDRKYKKSVIRSTREFLVEAPPPIGPNQNQLDLFGGAA